MVKKGLEFWVNKDIRRRSFDLAVFLHEPGLTPTEFIAAPPQFSQVQEGLIIKPTLPLTFEEATALMTELWNSGVRPSAVGSAGELMALKTHLEDMRRLVFSTKP